MRWTVIAVQVLPLRTIAVRFADGTEGIVDLSAKVGHGVFAAWNDPAAFAQVRLGEFGQPIWDDDIDLCPDTLYQAVSGHLPAEFTVPESAHA